MNKIHNILNKCNREFIPLIVVTVIIILFTFPTCSPDYGPGLDPSYLWGLNWLFVHDYNTLVHLIYPFGPLAFLRIPTYEGSNFIIYLFFLLFLKISFILLGFKVAKISDKQYLKTNNNWFAHSVFLLVASYFANIDLLIVFCCLFLCLITILERKWWSFVAASLLSATAMFIKVSIGLNAVSVVAVSIIVCLLTYREMRTALLQMLILLLAGLATAFAVLHHPLTVWNWLIGVFHLIFGYGSLSLVYDNKPFYLALFCFATLAMICVTSGKAARYTSLLLVIPLFAFWKHAIIREDASHYFGLVFFMVVFWMIISMMEERRKMLVMLLGAVSILSLMLNASDMDGYDFKNKKEFCGIANFTKPFFHYQQYVKEARDYTEWLLSSNQLPDTMLGIIGTSTTDIYPFDFSFAAQNKLNWQPRAALGNSLSPWLETKSAANFSSSDDAVRYVLMHFQDDKYGGKSVSIDNHYFLNDEPEVIRNILSHYQLAASTNRLLLLEHTAEEALGEPKTGNSFEAHWGEWVNVPNVNHAVVRLKVQSRKTLYGKVKSALFKEGIYFVEYQTNDGNIYQYQYDPDFAEEGLWCLPFVRFPCTPAVLESDVVRIRLLNNDMKSQKDDLKMAFEVIPIKNGIVFHR